MVHNSQAKVLCRLIVICAVFPSLLAGCVSSESVKNVDKVYFDLEGFLDRQLDTLSTKERTMTKTIHFNGKEEQQKYTVGHEPEGAFPLETLYGYVRWRKELKPFLDAGINKPALLDSYFGDTSQRKSGTIDSIVYKAKQSDLNTRELKVHFTQDGNLEKIYLHKMTVNPLYHSEQFLTYRPGAGYKIEGVQDVRFFDNDSFDIQVRW